jgi:surface polysaccharide O-acyltransferase-like enzyme
MTITSLVYLLKFYQIDPKFADKSYPYCGFLVFVIVKCLQII